MLLGKRWFPFVGWGKKLLPTDRTHWSSRDGKTAEAPNPAVPAPEGCAWQADWAYSDWQYAVDFPQDFGPTKTKTSCVRQRVWFRGFLGAATPSSGKGLGGAAPGAPQHAAYSAPLRAHAAAPTAFATIDAGKLFLLMKEGATKATRVIELADVAGVEDVHELEAGMPHMFTLTLDGRANAATKGAVVQLSTESQAASQLWKSELGRASRAARGTGTGFDVRWVLGAPRPCLCQGLSKAARRDAVRTRACVKGRAPRCRAHPCLCQGPRAAMPCAPVPVSRAVRRDAVRTRACVKGCAPRCHGRGAPVALCMCVSARAHVCVCGVLTPRWIPAGSPTPLALPCLHPAAERSIGSCQSGCQNRRGLHVRRLRRADWVGCCGRHHQPDGDVTGLRGRETLAKQRRSGSRCQPPRVTAASTRSLAPRCLGEAPSVDLFV